VTSEDLQTLRLRATTDEVDRARCESLQRRNMDRYRQVRAEAWDPARFAASWARFENFMIERDGEVVGCLRLLEVHDVLEIRDLQVEPGAQRRGIGRWAIGAALAIARRRGIGQLRLRVFADNPARALYARLGFEVDVESAGVLQLIRGVD
jgi:ribosomal protein S18 acetylase RimI-like enzyme